MKLKCKLVNMFTLVILFTGVIVVSVIKPHKRGFWCSDESIRYPRQPDTVGTTQLALIVLWLPLIVIFSCEFIALKFSDSQGLKRSDQNGNTNHREAVGSLPSQSSDSSFSLASWRSNVSPVIVSWLFSLFSTALLTGFIKVRVGRLRPVFYYLCSPSVSCDDQINQGVYLTNFTCAASDTTENFIRSSFPSGHSSFSISSMLFLVVYLSKRLNVTRANNLRYLIAIVQTIFLLIALYVGLSRIADNIHHWSDVLAGYILGAVITLTCTLTLGQLDGTIDKHSSPSRNDWQVREEGQTEELKPF